MYFIRHGEAGGFRVWGLYVLGFRVQGLGFRVQGSGCWVYLPPMRQNIFKPGARRRIKGKTSRHGRWDSLTRRRPDTLNPKP